MHEIIAVFPQLFAVRRLNDSGKHASEKSDMTLTLWRTAPNLWLPSDGAEREESVWLMCRLEAVGGRWRSMNAT